MPGKLSADIRSSFFLAAILFIVASGCKDDLDSDHTSWMDYGGGPDQSKYVITDDITKSNVNQLSVKWAYSTDDDRT
jgi:quinoprotein glucose dehydrogenase